jgi:monofunctional biosynthetic peptidoglycan transglycosylase
LERIAPALPLAVIASEDARFCRHWGVDWGALREVIAQDENDVWFGLNFVNSGR